MKCTVITKCNKKIDKRQAVETYLKINVTFSKSFQALNTPPKKEMLWRAKSHWEVTKQIGYPAVRFRPV